MTGLYNGLVSIYNNYIQPLISGVGQWMQQHKGPESYDKKLLVNNGKWIMGGFQSGLESGFEGGVIPYVSGMGRDIQDALGASVSSPFATTVGRAVGTQQQRQQPTMITAILELDRVQFGRLVYQLNGEETQRMGVNLAGGMA
jgi:phage-related protein